MKKELEEEREKMRKELEDEMKRKNNAKSASSLFLGPLSPPIKVDIPLAEVKERKTTEFSSDKRKSFLPVVSTTSSFVPKKIISRGPINIKTSMLKKYNNSKEALDALEKEYDLSKDNREFIKSYFS